MYHTRKYSLIVFLLWVTSLSTTEAALGKDNVPPEEFKEEQPSVQHMHPRRVRSCQGVREKCRRYGGPSLEITAGVGAITKGVTFAASSNSSSIQPEEIGVISVADVLIGLFLIVDGTYRLLKSF